jgi:two-component sensor histidine kinase
MRSIDWTSPSRVSIVRIIGGRTRTVLHEFLESRRSDIIVRTRVKIAARPAPRVTEVELIAGVPLLVDQLLEALKGSAVPGEMNAATTKHSNDLLRAGLTIGQVIHDYGHLCQAVTELAFELDAKIAVDEFRALNRCLDDAIAAAVKEYGRMRKQSMSDDETESVGAVRIRGSKGVHQEPTVKRLNALIERSLAEVRLESTARSSETILLAKFVEEVELAAGKEATVYGHQLIVALVEEGVEIEADRAMVALALGYLLQNAFKFTQMPGHVWLRTRVTADRVFIDIEDECGGLPPGRAAALFHPFELRRTDRSGLGLSISRKFVQSNGGDLQVRNLPGKACIFTIALPRKLRLAPCLSNGAS